MAQARRFGTTYGRNVIDIDSFPGNPGGTTSMLHYVDRNDNTAVTDIWDWRGFKSATRYYQTTGNVSNIIFYTPTGDIAARASFMWQHLEGKPNTEWPLVQTSLEVLDMTVSICGLRVKCMHGSISCNTSNKSETQRCVNNKHVEASDSYCRVLFNFHMRQTCTFCYTSK